MLELKIEKLSQEEEEDYLNDLEQAEADEWWNEQVEDFLYILQQAQGKKIRVFYYNRIPTEEFDVDYLINTFNEDWFGVVRDYIIL